MAMITETRITSGKREPIGYRLMVMRANDGSFCDGMGDGMGFQSNFVIGGHSWVLKFPQPKTLLPLDQKYCHC